MQDPPAEEHETSCSCSSSVSSETTRRGLRFAYLREEHWIGSPASLGHPPCTPTSESMTTLRPRNAVLHFPSMGNIDLRKFDADDLSQRNPQPSAHNEEAKHQAAGGGSGSAELKHFRYLHPAVTTPSQKQLSSQRSANLIAASSAPPAPAADPHRLSRTERGQRRLAA